jgi:hypothetical protein
MNMNTSEITPEQRAEFNRLVEEKVRQFFQVLEGEQPTFVVLEALIRLHRYTALQLPPDAMGYVSMALGEYAGELLRSSCARQSGPIH